MEEVKKVEGKEVKMNPGNGQEQPEDLQKVCDDLYNHNKQLEAYIQRLHKQLQQMDITIMTTRLNFLFKVVEIANNEHHVYSFDQEFVESCIAEIQQSITIPEEPQQEPKKD